MTLTDGIILGIIIIVLVLIVMYLYKNKNNPCSGCSSKKNCNAKCKINVEELKKHYKENK